MKETKLTSLNNSGRDQKRQKEETLFIKHQIVGKKEKERYIGDQLGKNQTTTDVYHRTWFVGAGDSKIQKIKRVGQGKTGRERHHLKIYSNLRTEGRERRNRLLGHFPF